MTAGTGIRHSEFNASRTEPVHFLQIWIIPEAEGLAPGYEQKTFAEDEKTGRLRLVGSRTGREGSITIHRDVDLYAGLLPEGTAASHDLAAGRIAWVQVARGMVKLGDEVLKEGDGAAITGGRIDLAGLDGAEVLVFDMAA
jgi:redox-sensitive bicupin YhaK (pirin superfamily)